jgi:uncharacterized protein (TIGR00106 family)
MSEFGSDSSQGSWSGHGRPKVSPKVGFLIRLGHADILPPAGYGGVGSVAWGWLDEGEERAVLVAFSVTPLGTGEAVGEIVAEAVRVVRESGLPNQTDAMFTTVEGEWDETMAVVKRAVDAVAARAPRVSVVLKADIRPGVTGALTAKVEAVERYLEG